MAPAKKERRGTFSLSKTFTIAVNTRQYYKVLLHFFATRHRDSHNLVVLKLNTLSGTETSKNYDEQPPSRPPPPPLGENISLFCHSEGCSTMIQLTYSVSKGVIQDPVGSIFGILRESRIIQELREQKKGQNL